MLSHKPLAFTTGPNSRMLKPKLSTARRGALSVTLIYAAVALLARPFSAYSHGDDFSYIRTALEYARTSHVVYNGWASMMLGWQAVWGAAIIHVFGFSFNALSSSMLVLSMACTYVFYGVLVRFGVRNAAFGTLTLALSPLFMPLSVSFMSDIPGLLSVLICIAMCQRAITAETDRATILWLIAACATNLLTGTVRQICWLGALVMIPATGYMLREKRGVIQTVVLQWTASLAFVLACLRWYNHQPYSVPEHVLVGHIRLPFLEHLGIQYIKVCLYLVLILLPVTIAWLSLWRSMTLRDTARIALIVLVIFAATAISLRHGALPNYIMPWFVPMLVSQGMTNSPPPIVDVVTVNLTARVIISLLVVLVGVVCVDRTRFWRSERLLRFYTDNQSLVWILFPFGVSVVCLISPRAMFSFIQDRYFLLLVPVLVPALLRVFEGSESLTLPGISYVVLLLFAYYGAAALHDREAGSRAEEQAMAALQNAGVPRNRIAQGFGPDEWYEVSLTGHVNANIPVHPANEPFLRNVPTWDVPTVCMPHDYNLIPHIHPQYILKSYKEDAAIGACYQPSRFVPVPYRAWVFPFHRAIYTVATASR